MNHTLNLFGSTRKKQPTRTHIPLYNQATVENSFLANGSQSQPDPLRLLVCVKESRFAASLYQEDICSLKNDHDLFKFLQDIYMHRRGKLYSLASIQAPERIKLVKVTIIRNLFFFALHIGSS